MAYTPELIKIDGEVPECGLVQDCNSLDIYDVFQCDSTYSIDTDSISISFAIEKSNRKRMDLHITDSRLQDYVDEDYTLVHQLK